jgi:hypothetical protein
MPAPLRRSASGVADTVAIMGFYTYLAMFNNATRLRPPVGLQRLRRG